MKWERTQYNYRIVEKFFLWPTTLPASAADFASEGLRPRKVRTVWLERAKVRQFTGARFGWINLHWASDD